MLSDQPPAKPSTHGMPVGAEALAAAERQLVEAVQLDRVRHVGGAAHDAIEVQRVEVRAEPPRPRVVAVDEQTLRAAGVALRVCIAWYCVEVTLRRTLASSMSGFITQKFDGRPAVDHVGAERRAAEQIVRGAVVADDAGSSELSRPMNVVFVQLVPV